MAMRHIRAINYGAVDSLPWTQPSIYFAITNGSPCDDCKYSLSFSIYSGLNVRQLRPDRFENLSHSFGAARVLRFNRRQPLTIGHTKIHGQSIVYVYTGRLARSLCVR